MQSKSLIQLGDAATQELDSIAFRFQDANGFDDEFITSHKKEMSSFVLPFLMKNKNKKNQLETYLNKSGIETRPFIAGNLLRQPFLKNFKNKAFKNSDFIHNNAFYIGNNQFLSKARLSLLEKLLNKFLS